MWWKADVEWKEGLLEPGSEGSTNAPFFFDIFFHDLLLVGINHGIEQDGLVAILTVHRL